MLGRVVRSLRAEARETNERRLLVLTGDRSGGLEAIRRLADSDDVDLGAVVFVGPRADLPVERVPMDRTGSLLGSTRDGLIFDAHDRLDPNALGRTVGIVRGGGLFVLLAPPLDDWPERRDEFDATLAAPPADVEDVSGHFRRRFVETLRTHPGIAIVDVDDGVVERDGLTKPAPQLARSTVDLPDDPGFPRAAYEACLTTGQVSALEALERVREPGRAVVIEADRGRGKSSVVGLAAACLAATGETILVTGPDPASTDALFERAGMLLDDLDVRSSGEPASKALTTRCGGSIRYRSQTEVGETTADVLFVDEAAAIPVDRLVSFLQFDRIGFATTVHGYEGAGRGFSIRFNDRLDRSDLAVTEVTLDEPIRYAPGDPLEVWSFRALLLDAAPAVDPLVADTTQGAVAYRELTPSALVDDEPLLREAFGLLVLAHYRTEPADLVRLLDAPNVSVRALVFEGHVVSIALLAREGGLSADQRARMYEGGRIRGNMLPDVFTSQLRDESAGAHDGLRVMRIATHAVARSRGLGSALIRAIRDEFAGELDWLGVGFGTTPELISFWAANGFSTVHLSTSRNAASGEHSILMLAPTSPDGRSVHDRHTEWFLDRVVDQLTDALDQLDPDVVRAALRAVDRRIDPSLSENEWRHLAAAAYGPGLIDVDPGPFRDLAMVHLVGRSPVVELSARAERLLVVKVLQARRWIETVAQLGYESPRVCMRSLGAAYRPIVDHFGGAAAHEERDRYLD